MIWVFVVAGAVVLLLSEVASFIFWRKAAKAKLHLSAEERYTDELERSLKALRGTLLIEQAPALLAADALYEAIASEGTPIEVIDELAATYAEASEYAWRHGEDEEEIESAELNEWTEWVEELRAAVQPAPPEDPHTPRHATPAGGLQEVTAEGEGADKSS